MNYEFQDQIEDIKRVTEIVTKSKELANEFLSQAGIFLEDVKEDNKENKSLHFTEKY